MCSSVQLCVALCNVINICAALCTLLQIIEIPVSSMEEIFMDLVLSCRQEIKFADVWYLGLQGEGQHQVHMSPSGFNTSLIQYVYYNTVIPKNLIFI